MNQCISFNRKNTVIKNDGAEIEIPEFVKSCFNRYRFNTETQVLERQCYSCQKWFEVYKLKDGMFHDIHNEKQYHFISEHSGFNTRCQKCLTPSLNNVEDKEKDLTKYTVFLTKENYRYIQIVTAAKNVKKTEYINTLLDSERKNNPISKYL